MVALAKPKGTSKTARMTRAEVERLAGERRRALVVIEPTRASEDGGVNRITIAASPTARDMFELDLDSLRTENYEKNPVVMWSHDTRGFTPSGGLPIGRSTKVTRTEGGGFAAEFEFLEGDEFAERVKNAWDQGFIRAASVSWGGGDWTFLENGRIRETNAELFEWSLVSVPADPDALRAAERALNVPEGTLGRGEEQRLADLVEALGTRVDELAEQVAALQAPAPDEPDDGDDEGDDGDEGQDDPTAAEDEEERALSAAVADLAAFVRAKE